MQLKDSLTVHVNYLLSQLNLQGVDISKAAQTALYTNAMVNLYNKHLDKSQVVSPDKGKVLSIGNFMRFANASKEQCLKYLNFIGVESNNYREVLDSVYSPDNLEQKNIYQKITHDTSKFVNNNNGQGFEGKSLQFYKDYACKNQIALSEMGHLMMSGRYLSSVSENEKNSNNKFMGLIDKLQNKDINLAILKALYGNGDIYEEDNIKRMDLYYQSKYDYQKPLTEKNLWAAIDDDRVFVRAIMKPAKYSAETEHLGSRLYEAKMSDEERQMLLRGGRDLYRELEKRREKRQETGAQIEFRKILREPGVPTYAKESKKNRLSKHGNPSRPVTKPDYGASLFEDTGYGIIKKQRNKEDMYTEIAQISNGSLDSGFGKMPTLLKKEKTDVIKEKLNNLSEFLKTGGAFRQKGPNSKAEFNETLMNINKEDVAFVFYYTGNIYRKGAESQSQRELLGLYTRETFKKEALKEANRLDEYIKRTGKFSLNGKLQEYIEISKRDIPIYEYSTNALYPKKKSYGEKEIVQLCKEDFFEFAKEHFEVLDKYSRLGDTQKEIFLNNANVVDKYMENEYIKIFRPELKAEIKKEVAGILKELSTRFMDSLNTSNSCNFQTLHATNIVCGGTILEQDPNISCMISRTSENFVKDYEKSKYLSKFEVKALSEILENKNRDKLFKPSYQRLIADTAQNILLKDFIQKEEKSIKISLNSYGSNYLELVKINASLKTQIYRELSSCLEEGKCKFDNDSFRKWPTVSSIEESAIQIYGTLKAAGFKDALLEKKFEMAFTQFVNTCKDDSKSIKLSSTLADFTQKFIKENHKDKVYEKGVTKALEGVITRINKVKNFLGISF